ncbi:MAG: DUF374 domain-containing protein [Candidatus Marinimicrobia bacterium]|nr:DUF374 domain-containing protein [Candidatus Neomarinimicrobiota bacterium]
MINKKKKLALKQVASTYGHIFLRILFSTCKYKELGTHHLNNVKRGSTSAILMFWHGYWVIPYYYLRMKNIIPLIGTHSDAETASLVAKKLGYSQQLRGSSNRRAFAVTAELLWTIKQPGKIIWITPDGPRGPLKKVKISTLKIIQKAGTSIIPLGASASRNRIFNSWDKFHQPKIFSKIAMVFGEPIKLYKNIDYNLDDLSEQISEKINLAQEQAEYEVKH